MKTPTPTWEEAIDKILIQLYLGNRFVGHATKGSIAHQVRENPALAKARAAINKAVLELVIGQDSNVSDLENPSWNEMRRQAAELGKNELRAAQRRVVKGGDE